jgi:cell division protein FtsW
MRVIIKRILNALKDTDKILLFASIIMFVFGLLNIATASSSEAVVRYNSTLFYYFNRQFLILLGSTIPFLYILITDTKKYKGYALIAYIAVSVLLLYLTFAGVFHKGAKAWINIFGVGLQPSELSKPVIIVCLAVIFETFRKTLINKEINKTNIFGIIAFVGFAIPFLVFLHKDLGTAMIISFISFAMLLASPILRTDKLKFITAMGVTLILSGLVIFATNGALFTSAQLQRFNFFDPCSRYETSGYQTCNGFIAMNDGGLFGLGMGKSKQKYSYIPEPHTDSIFAIISEEQGFIRTTLVFVGYYIILKRIFNIASKSNTIRGRYIAYGVGIYIFAHIMLNLGGLFAIIPLTGVPLPFLSYGGTFALSLSLALALVQRVHIETKNQHLKL